MRVNTFSSPQSIVDDSFTIKNHYVIVIYALRATSVITTALANGAKGVIPVMEIDEAVRLYQTLGADMALLCGERDGNPISGFHLGNSPSEYTNHAIGGKTLIMTTTNGTRAIHAAANATVLALGCMLNTSAVAADANRSGMDVTLLCAGTRGRFTIDDILAAGAIIDMLDTAPNRMDDLSIICNDYYRLHEGDLMGGLADCSHARYLTDAGYGADVAYCMQKDCLSAVPYYEKGLVRLL